MATRAETTRGDGTNTVAKALDLMDAVSAAPKGLSQSELADRLQLPRTTVYRLLATLIERGMIRRDPQRRVYCLGLRCFEMARQVHAMPDLAVAAAVELRALRDLTGETSYLANLDGIEVVGLERCDGAHSQRSQAVLGQRKPVYCTSQGKAILSAMDDESRDALVRELSLKPLTPLTITDRRRLQAELRVTSARGYAIDDEEIVLGVRCVGAPIVDGAGKVRGAISVAGPAYRLTPQRLELLGPEVAEAARRIGAQLQAVRPDLGDVEAQPVGGEWAFHGAFPRWHGGHLYWADVLAPSLRHLDAAWKENSAVPADRPIEGLLFRGEEVWMVHKQGSTAVGADLVPRAVPEWPATPVLAVCNGAGDEVWAATELPEGGCAIGLLNEAGRLQAMWRMGEPVQCLRWHDEAGLLYATAPASGAVLLLQPGNATLRRLATVPKGSGRVSGLAFDGLGGIWTALRDGWSVVRFTADGTLDRVVGLPVPCPTDLEIGGADGRALYITTARHSVPLDTLPNAPLSGRLFVLRLDAGR